MSAKLKSVVAQQLPDFVREDYPTFTAFVEAYYDYLDQTEKRNITDVRDIDTTVDEFIEYFKGELNVFGEQDYENIDKVLLMRKIKQVYAAKGSEAAHKFIFRVIFNKTAEISYPWDQVLKASDGKWKQETSIFVNVTSGNANLLPGNRIVITSGNTKIKAYTERVTFIRDNVYEIFIDKNYYGIINVGASVEFEAFAGTIIPTIDNYEILSPGENFKIGDIVVSNTLVGSENVQILFKVTSVDLQGGIKKISIIKFGAGYADDFFVLTSKQALATNSSSFVLSKNSIQQFSLPDSSSIASYQDFGYITNPDYWEAVFSNPSYTGTLLREFLSDTINNQQEQNFTLIRFNLGSTARYQGYYITNDGFTSDAIKLQDSYFYQRYSYLITVDERLEDYKTILKSYLHAAGVAIFGEYQIQNNYAPGVSGELLLDIYQSRASFNTINKGITNEFFNPDDIGGRIRINPYDDGSYVVADYNPGTFQDFNPNTLYTP